MPAADIQQFDLALLREHVRISPGMAVLEQGYYDTAAALWAAGEAGQGGWVLALRPAIHLAAELDTLAAQSGIRGLEVRVGDDLQVAERAAFDVALVLAPSFLGNATVRHATGVAAAGLRPDGTLYLQVHKKHGGDTFVRFAGEAFEQVEMLGIGAGQRRLYAARGPRPDAVEAREAPGEAQLHSLSARGVSLQLRLTAGVFAARGIDPGSQLLLDTVQTEPAARILDLGCGAGTIGLALAAADKRSSVVLVDTSKAAVDLARENAERNGLANVDVRLGDAYAAVRGERFTHIVSNLPAHRGHQQDTGAAEGFITGAPAFLREGGDAWFVANKALLYELPASRAFREVRQAASNPRYKVLHCRLPRSGGR